MFRRKPDFYLGCSEDSPRLEEPRCCWSIKRYHVPGGYDQLLIRIDPPVDLRDYHQGWVDRVVIAARLSGTSLFPICKWPLHVYVGIPLVADPEKRDSFGEDELKLCWWGELYPTEEAARAKKV